MKTKSKQKVIKVENIRKFKTIKQYYIGMQMDS